VAVAVVAVVVEVAEAEMNAGDSLDGNAGEKLARFKLEVRGVGVQVVQIEQQLAFGVA
jgi:hypothetical protein